MLLGGTPSRRTTRATAALLGIALVGLALLVPATSWASEGDVTRDVVSFINRARAERGLAALALYGDTSQAHRANDHFVATGHPHGRFQESADWYIGRGATGFGENQAYSSSTERTAGWVVSEWSASSSHRDVMFTADANYLVVAVSCAPSGMHVTAHVVTVPDGATGGSVAGGAVSPAQGASCGAAAPPPPPPPPPPPARTQQAEPPPPSTAPAETAPSTPAPADTPSPTPPSEPEPPTSPLPGERTDGGLAPLDNPERVRLAAAPATAPTPSLQDQATSSQDGSLGVLLMMFGALLMLRQRARRRD